MPTQNLYFNILTFDFPAEPQTFYFSKNEISICKKIHRSVFPNYIETIFPGITSDGTQFIYTTFDYEKEGFIPLAINFETENRDFIHKYYSRKINYYFKVTKEQLVKVGKIGENQVWVHSPVQSCGQFDVYYRFSLKVQFCNVSNFPELVISYDGHSRVFKVTTDVLVKRVSPSLFRTVVKDNRIYKYKELADHDEPGYDKAFPVLNIPIASTLEVARLPKPKETKYKYYRKLLKQFYKVHIDVDDFKEIVAIQASGFLKVNPDLIKQIGDCSNDLKFLTKVGRFPKTDFRDLKPVEPVKGNVHLFYIYHVDDTETKILLQKSLEERCGIYPGLATYAYFQFHPDRDHDICFTNREDPLPELEEFFQNKFQHNPAVKYLALYLTPFTKEETRKQEVKIYPLVKQLLIRKKVACQSVEAETVNQGTKVFQYSLTTMSVSIVAKLGGIPWRLDKAKKEELIVGVGAFMHPDGVRYISSAFCFDNMGHFKELSYLMAHQTTILAGNISAKVKEFSRTYGQPKRLIIHFYKRMSQKELAPIEAALNSLKFPNPVTIFIITVNKTDAKDIVAFDMKKSNPEQMPFSGTYINIGNNKYLLFNNSRFPSSFNARDGYPFPAKLQINCNDKKQLQNGEVVHELIDQVYQFSRMYWKSLAQQGLPVTITYPEMVAEVAPYFEGGVIPEEGKDTPWFL